MCKLKKYKTCNTSIDKCIRPLIKWLLDNYYAPVGSCCGHDKHPITVVVRRIIKGKVSYYELFTNTKIPRSRNFYNRDDEGYYHIPEVTFTIKKEKKKNSGGIK